VIDFPIGQEECSAARFAAVPEWFSQVVDRASRAFDFDIGYEMGVNMFAYFEEQIHEREKFLFRDVLGRAVG
jgi:hypothetical protein